MCGGLCPSLVTDMGVDEVTGSPISSMCPLSDSRESDMSGGDRGGGLCLGVMNLSSVSEQESSPVLYLELT